MARKRRQSRGLFITIEGIEGSGKTTQAALLARALKRDGYKVLLTSEPGGSTVGRAIRSCLLNPKAKVDPLAELMLFEADRAQHLSEMILPALRRGHVVICDRYSDSTYAYQGFARGLGLDVVAMTDRIVTHGADPDVTILLDLPVEQGLARVRRRGKVSRIDAEDLRFHRKVRLGYLSLAKISSERVHIIHVRPDPKDTAELVYGHVSRMLRKGKC